MATPLWPFYGSVTTTTDSNQAMVGYLLRTETAHKALHNETKRNLQGLGIEIAQCREENLGIPRVQLARRIGLDSGFLCLLEEGKVLPLDITEDIWERIRKIKGFRYSYRLRI